VKDPLNSLDVLFVEDEANIAQLVKRAIGARFRRFELAADGEAGLEAFRRERHDLVITDITMPRMDGLEMSGAIHAISPQTPIVVLSAYSDKEKLLGAIDVGIVKYFIKPFDPAELLEYLEELAAKLVARQRVAILPDYLYDRGEGVLYRCETPIPISGREQAFIEALLERPGHLMDVPAIKELLWPGETTTDDAVRVFVNRLRKKTGKDFLRNRSREGYYLLTKR
jgi:DNA-binding response OmpR family regulator